MQSQATRSHSTLAVSGHRVLPRFLRPVSMPFKPTATASVPPTPAAGNNNSRQPSGSQPSIRRQHIAVTPRAASSSSRNDPSAPETTPAAPASVLSYPPEFIRARLVTFIGIVFGYSCFYLTRNSLTYTAPALVADASLGIGMTEIGTMTSIFPIAYGTSKFISGVLGSRTSPRLLLGLA